MPLTDWPQAERPREKLLAKGPSALSDAEILAIFIRTGVKGKTAIDLARESLQKFGGLRSLLTADKQQFCQQRGLGLAKYAQIQAALEINRRHFAQTLQYQDVIENSHDTKRYLSAKLRDYQHEVFACLFLDSKNRIISYNELSHGTINSASVHPRQVVKQALLHNATGVIAAHNHPSGSTEPSEADQHLTERLKSALALVDVQLLDHIIVGDGQTTSFGELGLL